jgi:hypothetical protein
LEQVTSEETEAVAPAAAMTAVAATAAAKGG